MPILRLEVQFSCGWVGWFSAAERSIAAVSDCRAWNEEQLVAAARLLEDEPPSESFANAMENMTFV